MINKNLKILKELVETSGNCVNLGRSMKVHDLSLYQWVLDNTSFLDSKNNVKFNERVYCILNDMHEIQLNMYGENAKFVNLFSGYSLKKNKYKRNESFRKKIELKEHRRQMQKNTPKKTSIDKFRKEITAGYKTGLAGTPGAYHMDHMFSIMDGYKNQVSPLLIGNKSNLKMIPWKENLIKHSSSSISFETLLSNTKYTLEKSQREYACFLDLIETDIKNQIPISGAALMEKFYESELYK